MTMAAGAVWMVLGLSIIKSEYPPFLAGAGVTMIVGFGTVALALFIKSGALRMRFRPWLAYASCAMVAVPITYHGIVLLTVG